MSVFAAFGFVSWGFEYMRRWHSRWVFLHFLFVFYSLIDALQWNNREHNFRSKSNHNFPVFRCHFSFSNWNQHNFTPIIFECNWLNCVNQILFVHYFAVKQVHFPPRWCSDFRWNRINSFVIFSANSFSVTWILIVRFFSSPKFWKSFSWRDNVFIGDLVVC